MNNKPDIEKMGRMFWDMFSEDIDCPEDRTKPPGEMQKERSPTDLDPTKKFQCEMAERIFSRITSDTIDIEKLESTILMSNQIAKKICDYVFS